MPGIVICFLNNRSNARPAVACVKLRIVRTGANSFAERILECNYQTQ